MSNSEDHEPRRGLMLVISSPSGAGKTTLARMLMKEFDDVVLLRLCDDARAAPE